MPFTVLLILRFLDCAIEAAIEFWRLIPKSRIQKSRNSILNLTVAVNLWFNDLFFAVGIFYFKKAAAFTGNNLYIAIRFIRETEPSSIFRCTDFYNRLSLTVY